jgi:hypothetical protein
MVYYKFHHLIYELIDKMNNLYELIFNKKMIFFILINIPFSNQTRTTQIIPLINSEATIAVDEIYGSGCFVRE